MKVGGKKKKKKEMGLNQPIYNNTAIGLLSNTSGKKMGVGFFYSIVLTLKMSSSKYGLQFKKHNRMYTCRKVELHLYRKHFLSFWKLRQPGLTSHKF